MDSETKRSPLTIVFIVTGILVTLLAVGFVLQKRLVGAPAAGTTNTPFLTRIGLSGNTAPTCLPVAAHPPIAPLKLAESRARQLTGEQQYAEAMSLYHDIAVTDPTFPGLNLDMSVVLLQVGRTDDSDRAIEAQLATSKCLTTLPTEQLQAYCKSELPGTTLPACQQQVQGMLRTAHLQAALVQMQLGRGPGAEPVSAATTEAPPAAAAPVSRTPYASQRPTTGRSYPPGTTAYVPSRVTPQRNAETLRSNRYRSLPVDDGSGYAQGAYSR